MKFEIIIIKNPKTNKNMSVVLKHNETDRLLCSCNGKHTEAEDCNAFVFDERNRKLSCPECGKELEIIQTPAEKEEERRIEEEKRNREKLANLHLVEVGSDWECGFKYYGLSAHIEYEDWGKIKQHFRYYNQGWSRGQELEWNYGEPTGWLTQNPEAVEEILVDAGLIKPENTMDAIEKRAESERKKEETKMKEQREKRENLQREMNHIKSKIDNYFSYSDKVRELDDAEANKCYLNPTYGKCTVLTYTITDTEIIKCRNMGDFKYGIAIPYSEKLENLIVEYEELNKELWNYH